jgi:hypothetical protein
MAPVMPVKGGTGGWGNSQYPHIQPGMFAKSNPGKSGYARECRHKIDRGL